MNSTNCTTNTVQNSINNNNNEADPNIRLLDTLYLDKNLTSTENREYSGFSSSSHMILLFKLANLASLGHVTAHVYRHCFATFSLEAGAPLTAVRDAMNHKSINTTSLYLHATEKDVSNYI